MGHSKDLFLEEQERFYAKGLNESIVNEKEIYFGEPKVLFHVVVPNFTNSIIVANKIRVVPYLKGRSSPKIPAKYKTKDYAYNGAGKLANVHTGEICISNPQKAGTARIWVCNGQDLYNGTVKEHARADYMQKMKDYVLPYIDEQQMIYEKGMSMKIRFFLTRKTKNVDNINLWVWPKIIGDVMKKHVIPDDDVDVLPGDDFKTIFVEKEEEARMEISLIK